MGGDAIKTILTVLFVAGLFVAFLGLIRVPFAVRFWRRLQWVAWVYMVVLVLSALRLIFFA